MFVIHWGTCRTGRNFHVTIALFLSQHKIKVGIATHELGHALGLFHTMSRYDRDEFITVVLDNVVVSRIYTVHNKNRRKFYLLPGRFRRSIRERDK